jgi:hypothetical protein
MPVSWGVGLVVKLVWTLTSQADSAARFMP